MAASARREAFLTGASVIALEIALGLSPAHATGLPPGISLSIEGGAACSFGDEGALTASNSTPFIGSSATAQFPDSVCGWTGRIGLIDNEPPAFFGNADYWGIFLRHTRFDEDGFSGQARTSQLFFAKYVGIADVDFMGGFNEDRTVIDFEVGQDLGIGSTDVKLRGFVGLRYARYHNEMTANGSNYYVVTYILSPQLGAFNLNMENEFNGAGPRVGLSGLVPLGGAFGLAFSGSASALYGWHDMDFRGAGTYGTSRLSSFDSDWVFNLEGEASLVFTLAPGANLFLGLRTETWFDQFETNLINFEAMNSNAEVTGGGMDRHNWGPFIRFGIPLS